MGRSIMDHTEFVKARSAVGTFTSVATFWYHWCVFLLGLFFSFRPKSWGMKEQFGSTFSDACGWYN